MKKSKFGRTNSWSQRYKSNVNASQNVVDTC